VPPMQAKAPFVIKCKNAISLPVDGTAVAIGSTIHATVDSSFSSICTLNENGNEIDFSGSSVWYLVDGNDQRIVVTTCHKATNFDTVIAVYENENCNDLLCQASIVHTEDGKVTFVSYAANDNDDSCQLATTNASTVAWDSRW